MFAEQEIVLPKGPRRGMPFSVDFMPLSGFILEAMGSDYWRKLAIIGPTQSGKSLLANNLPMLYYLCELEEDIIVGLPDMDLARGVWNEKILPVIAGTKYRDLLPTSGAGAKGGVPNAIQLKNGAWLRFMAAGGGDAQRSSHTARVIIMTEVDKMDDIGEASEEADPVRQIEMRADAFEHSKIIMECTVTHEGGRIWQEAMVLGSGGQVFVPCPVCGKHQIMDRSGLFFEEDDAITAEETARYRCAKCGDMWDERKRRLALERPVLVHRGQSVGDDGKVIGDLPRTRTFGMQWNVLYSPMQSLGKTAAQQWTVDKSGEQEAQKAMVQSKWAIPWVDETVSREVNFSMLRKMADSSGVKLGVVPRWASWVVMAVDVQKRCMYWHAEAYAPNACSQVIDYGVIDILDGAIGTSRDDDVEVDPDREASDESIHRALGEAAQIATKGWPGATGARHEPRVCLVDTGYRTDVIQAWLRNRTRWHGVKGIGKNQRGKITGAKAIFQISDIVQIRQQDDGSFLWFVNVDHTKALVHDRFFIAEGEAGHTTIPADVTRSYLFHLTAERREYDKTGDGFTWVKQRGRRRNDYLDCRSYGVAAHKFLVNVEAEKETTEKHEPKQAFIDIGNRGDSWL